LIDIPLRSSISALPSDVGENPSECESHSAFIF
jgi:hypothetical protein